jgi:rhamnogalacturonyl hydrolase YesR
VAGRGRNLFSRRTVVVLLAAVLVLGAGILVAVVLGAGSRSTGLPVGAGLNSSLDFSPTHAKALGRTQYLALAEQGIAKTSTWWDSKLRWYRDYLGDDKARPLEALWDTISMFELLDEVAIAQPNANNRRAVESFADYYIHYWNPNLEPTPGYAPYPGQRGKQQTTWYDDNGWLGLAFLDADQATGTRRYLSDAEHAMAFIEAGGWDATHGGGMWWDTQHPWHSGEALAADTDLAARLYQVTHQAQYLESAVTWMTWANQHLRQKNGVYIRTSTVPYGSETYTGSGPQTSAGNRQSVSLPPGCRAAKSIRQCVARLCKSNRRLCPGNGRSQVHANAGHASNATPKSVAMPHDGEGAMLSAMVTLYQATHERSWLAEAERFAPNIIKWLEPFDDGPQYDGIMLRGFVALYAQDHSTRWYTFLTSMASLILQTARNAPGVYLKAWGGGPIPSAVPGMLRTDTSSLMVFADLATVSAPK